MGKIMSIAYRGLLIWVYTVCFGMMLNPPYNGISQDVLFGCFRFRWSFTSLLHYFSYIMMAPA